MSMGREGIQSSAILSPPTYSPKDGRMAEINLEFKTEFVFLFQFLAVSRGFKAQRIN